MSLLLHTCCAPCSVACVKSLRAEGIEPVGFWYNPNIHPVKEYRLRKQTLIEYAASIHEKLIIEDEYGLRKFIDTVYPDYRNRCEKCYAMRLFETAKVAKERGFDSFSTTLLVSPYQNHQAIIDQAHLASEAFEIPFVYRDFRPMYEAGHQEAYELGLYLQKYCGCIFSEEDRYQKK